MSETAKKAKQKLPYTLVSHGDGTFRIDGKNGVHVTDFVNEDEGNFIVSACNSHEALVAVLNRIHEFAKGPLPWSNAETRRQRARIEAWSRAAIALAEKGTP